MLQRMPVYMSGMVAMAAMFLIVWSALSMGGIL